MGREREGITEGEGAERERKRREVTRKEGEGKKRESEANSTQKRRRGKKMYPERRTRGLRFLNGANLIGKHGARRCKVLLMSSDLRT